MPESALELNAGLVTNPNLHGNHFYHQDFCPGITHHNGVDRTLAPWQHGCMKGLLALCIGLAVSFTYLSAEGGPKDSSSASGALGAPQNVSIIQPSTNGMISLTWDPVPNAIGYQVWRHATEDPNLAIVLHTNVISTSFHDDSVRGNETHYYWIAAFNETATGGKSESVNGMQSQRLWTRSFGNWYYAQLPAILPDGRIAVPFGLGEASIMGGLALLHSDGTEAWRTELPGSPIVRPVAGPSGRIYASTIYSNTVLCLDPSGHRIWEVAIGSSPTGALALDRRETVYVLHEGTGGSGILLSAISKDGAHSWTSSCGGSQSAWLDAHASIRPDGDIVVGNTDKCRKFHPNGQLAWLSLLLGRPFSSASILPDDRFLTSSERGDVFMWGQNGSCLWSNRNDRPMSHGQGCEVAIGRDHQSVLVQDNGFIRRVSSDGTTATALRLPGSLPHRQTPALSHDGTIWVAAGGCLLMVDAGDKISVAAQITSAFVGSPILTSDGILYLVDRLARLHAFPAAPLDTEAPWPMYRGNPAGTACQLPWMDPAPRLTIERGVDGWIGFAFPAYENSEVVFESSEDLLVWQAEARTQAHDGVARFSRPIRIHGPNLFWRANRPSSQGSLP